MKLIALLLLFCGALFAQNPKPCTNVTNTAAAGQVLSASRDGNTPPCTWVNNGGGGGSGTVTSITLAGTANEITVTGTCTVTTTGTCTFSVPTDFRLPGTINKITLTQPASGATLTLADGKTFTVSKTLTLDGTDGMTITFPAPASVTDQDCAKLTKTGTTIGIADAGSACGAGGGTVTVVGGGSLTSTALVTGGGTTTIQTPSATATLDTSGNISTPGGVTTGAGSSAAGFADLGAGTAHTATGVGFQSPTAITTPFMMTLPALPATGFMLNTGTTDPSVISYVAGSGSGNVCLTTNCAMTTPNLGTPSAATLTNATGLPLAGLATQAADTVVMNKTGGTASPTASAMPTCTTGADLYNTRTHTWSCVSTGGGASGLSPFTTVALTNANWSTIGSGGTRANTSNNGPTGGATINITGTTGGTGNVYGVSATVAAGDFTITIGLYAYAVLANTSSVQVGFTDGTKVEGCGFVYATGTALNTTKTTALSGGTYTVANGNVAAAILQGNANFPINELLLIQLTRTGTNLSCAYSPDGGMNYVTAFTDTVPFLTASSILVYADPRASASAPHLTLFSCSNAGSAC